MKIKINTKKQKLSPDSTYHINENGVKVSGSGHVLHLIYTEYGGKEEYDRARDEAAAKHGAEEALKEVMPLLKRYDEILKAYENEQARKKREYIRIVPNNKSV